MHYTVVVYRRKRVGRVVLYVGPTPIVFSTSVEIGGRVRRRWSAGGVPAVSLRVKASEVAPAVQLAAAELCGRYLKELDGLFREAAREGYRPHRNDVFVRLWLEGRAAGEEERIALGPCVSCLTNSYGRWVVNTPPWCCAC
jgi:hypothetical protein